MCPKKEANEKELERKEIKQTGREASRVGWNPETGKFHESRRNPKFATHGQAFERKSFGRHPNASFLKGGRSQGSKG